MYGGGLRDGVRGLRGASSAAAVPRPAVPRGLRSAASAAAVLRPACPAAVSVAAAFAFVTGIIFAVGFIISISST